ncbi:MAG: ABC transporter substrate-binding protein [Reyranella sp.]|nr:ABC transporter substrate-binding protein [Reyranella sp.]
MHRRHFLTLAAAAAASPAHAQKKYDPGSSDTEIRLGQTLPYSGPASVLSGIGKGQVAYFRYLNETQGGINGRKVTLLSLDDGYSPPKTIELTRQLVERDNVLAIVNTIGTATNRTIHRYLNQKKVPQLLILSGAAQWNDPKNYPWTMMGMIAYQTEGAAYARNILTTTPNARIALLRQNDDFGKDYVEGFKHALGDKASMVVAEVSYETTDPTVDAQIIQLRASNADALFIVATGKHATQAMRKAHELGWKPQIYLPVGSASVPGVLKPAGTDAATGVITAATAKSAGDPAWDDDPGMKQYLEWAKKWAPELNPLDSFVSGGYSNAIIVADLLRRCGDLLTRENFMRQATSLQGYTTPLTLPGVSLDTSQTDYLPYQTLRLQRFDGTSFKLIGDVIRE